MTAIVTGSGLGLQRSSANVLGSAGQFGSATLGRSSDGVFVNAANGNLIIQNNDEVLLGRGPDATINRTYNSLGTYSNLGGTADVDNWWVNNQRKIVLSGTANAAGSTATLTDWDGSIVTFTFVSAAVGYKASEGPYQNDTLTFAGTLWTWTEGKSRTVQTFESLTDSTTTWRIKSAADADGNSVTYTYEVTTAGSRKTTDRLTRIATAEDTTGQTSFVTYVYDTATGKTTNLLSVTTSYYDLATLTNKTLTRVRYTYDTLNRLSTVRVDKTPGDGTDTATNDAYITTYTYAGTTGAAAKQVATITQSDGTSLTIAYDSVGRVKTLTQLAEGTTSRITTIAYSALQTTVTDPVGVVTVLVYDSVGRLIRKIEDAQPQNLLLQSETIDNASWTKTSATVTANDATRPTLDGASTADKIVFTANGMVQQTVPTTITGGTAGGTYVADIWVYSATAQSISLAINDNVNGQRKVTVALAAGQWTRLRQTAAFAGASTTRSVQLIAGASGGTFWVSQAQLRANPTDDVYTATVAATASPTVTSSVARISEFTYNANGLPLSAAVYNGQTNYQASLFAARQSNVYDTNGNLIEQQDALGNTTRYTYGTKNELLTATQFLVPDPDGTAGAAQPTTPLVTNFAYDIENHLRFAVSPEGRVTEYRYDLYGNQVAEIAYAGNSYTGAYTEAALASWVSTTADKTQTQRIDTVYDFRLNVTSVTAYSKTDAAGTGLGTEDWSRIDYTYDQYGKLLTRRVSGTNALGGEAPLTTESFVYDGLGRVISMVDIYGVSSTIAINDGTRVTTITTPGDVTTTSTYNIAGELVSYLENVTGTTAFAYDKLGRLRVKTDPLGIKTYYTYDAESRLTATIDGDGSITEYKYDVRGLVVATVRYATVVSGPNLTTLGTVTTNTRVGTVRPAAAPADRWSWNIYDTAGRLVETIDGAGAVAVLEYDGASRLSKTTRYATALVSTMVDGFKITIPTALSLPAVDVTNDRVFRNFYDNDGLLLGTLDEEGFLTEVVYDKAGRRVETIGYSGAAASAQWVSGTFAQLKASITLSAANDIHNYWIYDGRGRVVATIEGEGNATRYHYTARGDIDQEIRGQQVTASTSYTMATLPAPTGTLETTRFYRNAAGQVTSQVRTLTGGTETTSFSYDTRGRLVTQTTSETISTETRTQRFRYDAKGRLIGSLGGVGAATLVASPTDAQIDAAILTYGTRYAYNAADQLISRIDPDGTGSTGNKTLFYYDTDSQLRFQIDALGEVTEYRYNVLEDRTDTYFYGTRLAPATYSGWTGGLVSATVNTAVTSAVAAIANTTLDSRMQFAFDTRGDLTTAYNPLYVASPTQSNYGAFYYNAFGEVSQAISPTDTPAYHWENQTYGYHRRGLLYYNSHLLNGSATGAVQSTYSYDGFGRVYAQHTNNTDWRYFGFAYDRANRTTQTTDQMGRTTAAAYDARSNQISSTDRNGKVTTFAYDLFNRNVTTTTAEGVVSTVKRNAYGQTIQIVDGAGRTSSYTYDKNGNLKTVTDAAGTTTNNYDNADRLIESIDAKGVSTRYTYDAVNRVLTRVEDFGSGKLNLTTSMAYDAKGQQISMTDALGVVTTYTYDLKGQKTRVIQDAGSGKLNITTDFVYRADGKVTQQVDAVGTAAQRTTLFEYDTLGRQTRKTEDQGSGKLNQVTNYVWDENNNLVATSDNLARVTRFVYDLENRLQFSVDAEGQVTESGYDNEGRVAWTRQYANPIAAATLAGFGNKITAAQVTGNAATSVADRITRTFYDGDGRAVYAVDAEGYVTRNAYDGANNVLKTWRYAAAVSVDNTATKATLDALVPAGDPSDAAITTYTYDGANRLTDVTSAFSQAEATVTHFVMDALGQITDTTVAYGTSDAVTTHRVFDNLGRVTSETRAYGAAEAATTSFVYDAHSMVTQITDARGYVTTRSYDNLGRVLSETVPLDASSSATTSFQYDARGNKVKITDPRGNSGYFYYDNLDRLTLQVDPEGVVVKTEYAIGSVVAKVTRYAAAASNLGSISATVLPTYAVNAAVDAVTQFTYDKIDRVKTSIDAEGFTESYSYDALGNRTSVTNKLGGVTNYAYDKRGLMASETRIQNTYDYAGTLVLAQVVTSYSYDARGNLVQRFEGSNIPASGTNITYGRLITSYAYDKLDRLTSQTDPAFLGLTPVTTWQYDKRSNVILQTAADGGKTYSFYDRANRKTEEISPVLTLSNWTYDANGNVTAQRIWAGTTSAPVSPGGTAPAGGGAYRETQLVYDRNNRLIQTVVVGVRTGAFNGSSYVTTAGQNLNSYNQYDAAGNLIKETDANGNAIYHYYDKRGKETAKVDQEGFLTTWSRDADGNVLSETRFANKYTGAPVAGGTAPSVVASADDRTTTFTYDKMGRRLTEARLGVLASTVSGNAVTTASQTATVTYTYNALGEVKSKLEATGDKTEYQYDAQGRLERQLDAVALDVNGSGTATVRHTSYFYYDANNNLVRTLERAEAGISAAGAAGTVGSYAAGYSAADDRVNVFGYSGNKLQWTQDALGNQRNSWYDVMGRKTYDYYQRANSAGVVDTVNAVYDGNLTSYDLAGRAISQWQANYNSAGAWVTQGPVTQFTYNTFGEVTSRVVGGYTEETFEYDNAGRVAKSTGGDGVVKFVVYDANGNATLLIQSNGRDMTADTVDSVLAYIGAVDTMTAPDVVATITTYDKRNMGLATREPQRTIANINDVSLTTVATLVRSRTYNAFGEALSETDARGNITNYTYNTMGRLLQKQAPTVNVTDEAGNTAAQRPTENYAYDISGRLVGVQSANGFWTTRVLRAGTGYGGSDAVALKEFRPDSTMWEVRYNAFGNTVESYDGLGRKTANVFDKGNRLIQVIKPSGFSDSYGYDVLGQRVKHWNSFLQSPVYGTPVWVESGYWDNSNLYEPMWIDTSHYETPIIGYTPSYETTDYDIQGRVTSEVNFAGDVTTYTYSWSAAANSGLGLTGGWTKSAALANGHTTSETTDFFGRMLSRTDMGGHVYTYNYNRAGQLASQTSTAGQSIGYSYFNTGKLAAMNDNSGTISGYSTSNIDGAYTYDADGNRTYERLAGTYTYYDYYNGYGGTYSVVMQEGRGTYDGLNRLLTFTDAGASGNGAVSITNQYDAAGNVRHTVASHATFNNDQTLGATVTDDYWYKYDALNRMATVKGSLVGGVITTTSAQGLEITYNAAGGRATQARKTYVYSNYTGYDSTAQEIYSYNADGAVTSVSIATDGAAAVLRAATIYDAMGRTTDYKEYAADGTTVQYNRYAIGYDNRNAVTNEASTLRRTESDGYLYVNYASTYNSYGAGGVLNSSGTSNYRYKYGTQYQDMPDTSTTYTYAWWDGAQQATVSFKPNTAQATTYTTQFNYDVNAHLSSVNINDGRPRTVTYITDAAGQILKRTEADNVGASGDPVQAWWFFDGKQLGTTGNNGNDDPEYATALNERVQPPSTSTTTPFRLGSTTGTQYSDFDEAYNSLSPGEGGGAGSSYTVRNGDTLNSIAQAVYGDASLWYMIADANGLSGSSALVGGQVLKISGNLGNVHNTSDTFRPYDAGRAIGDIQPTTPTPPKNASKKCGVFGQILLAVISIAVAVVLTPVIGPVGAAVVGNLVSQGVGLATGIQDKFSFKSLAMTAITAGVAQGLDKVGAFAKLGIDGAVAGSKFLGTALRAALTNTVTQGIGVATGLQGKFDFAGVAAAGMAAGVGEFVGGKLKLEKMGGSKLGPATINGNLSFSNITKHLVTGMAGTIASVATRSVVDGSDFGDNLLNSLPQSIGNTIGDALGNSIARHFHGHYDDVDSFITGRSAELTRFDEKNGTNDRNNPLFYTMPNSVPASLKRQVWQDHLDHNLTFGKDLGEISTIGEFSETTHRGTYDRTVFSESQHSDIAPHNSAYLAWADLEETMHFLDSEVWDRLGKKNGDSPGDEGALFAYMTSKQFSKGGPFANYAFEMNGATYNLNVDTTSMALIGEEAINTNAIIAENRWDGNEHFGPAGHYYSAFVFMMGGLQNSDKPKESWYQIAHQFALGAQLGDRVHKINAAEVFKALAFGYPLEDGYQSKLLAYAVQEVFHALVPPGADPIKWQEDNRNATASNMESSIKNGDYLAAGLYAHWIGDSYAHRYQPAPGQVYNEAKGEWVKEYKPVRGFKAGQGHLWPSVTSHAINGLFGTRLDDPVDSLHAKKGFESTSDYANFMAKHIGSALASSGHSAESIEIGSLTLWHHYYDTTSTDFEFADRVKKDFPTLNSYDDINKSIDRDLFPDENKAVESYISTWHFGNK